MKRVKHAVILGMALTLAAGAALRRQRHDVQGSVHLPEADGAAIYRATCQACHMTNAKGATGAATIPALAGDPKLATRRLPIYVVVNGLGGMPALAPISTTPRSPPWWPMCARISATATPTRSHPPTWPRSARGRGYPSSD